AHSPWVPACAGTTDFYRRARHAAPSFPVIPPPPSCHPLSVIPAKAGIQGGGGLSACIAHSPWVPACAGTTGFYRRARHAALSFPLTPPPPSCRPLSVIPATAGIPGGGRLSACIAHSPWDPACAGTTGFYRRARHAALSFPVMPTPLRHATPFSSYRRRPVS